MHLTNLLLIANAISYGLALTYRSADISSLLVEEGEGKSYKDVNGKSALLENM
jgi:hypothetical protein